MTAKESYVTKILRSVEKNESRFKDPQKSRHFWGYKEDLWTLVLLTKE